MSSNLYGLFQYIPQDPVTSPLFVPPLSTVNGYSFVSLYSCTSDTTNRQINVVKSTILLCDTEEQKHKVA